MTYLITTLIAAFVLNEAVYGKQKRFARYGIATLFGNMVLFNLGVYSEQTSNFIIYSGLIILAVMMLIRLGWFFKRKLTNQS